MSDNVLGISKDILEEEKVALEEDEAPKVVMKVADTDDDDESDEEETPSELDQDEIFDRKKPKPKKDVPEPVVLTKKGKPKRKMTEKQLDNLALAREKSKVKRAKTKEDRLKVDEAKKIDSLIRKEEKRIAKEKKREEADDALAQSEAVARLVAEQTKHIQSTSTWDEERLSALMDKTIDNFVARKRAEKEKPRQVVSNTPPVTYMPAYAPMMVQQHQQQQQQQPDLPQPKARRKKNGNTMEDLFGIFED
jgi:hypothetical protein